jgi:hypothetical protein
MNKENIMYTDYRDEMFSISVLYSEQFHIQIMSAPLQCMLVMQATVT